MEINQSINYPNIGISVLTKCLTRNMFVFPPIMSSVTEINVCRLMDMPYQSTLWANILVWKGLPGLSKTWMNKNFKNPTGEKNGVCMILRQSKQLSVACFRCFSALSQVSIVRVWEWNHVAPTIGKRKWKEVRDTTTLLQSPNYSSGCWVQKSSAGLL